MISFCYVIAYSPNVSLQPAQKRMWDDAEKRLVVMSDMLNNHELSSGVTDRMIALAQGE